MRTHAANSQPRYVIYLLLVVLIYFACHGHFSFWFGDSNSTLAERSGNLMIEEDGGGTLVIVFRLFAYGLAGYLCITNYVGVLRGIRQSPQMIALSLLAILSVVWSQFPRSTLKSGLYLIVDTAFAYYISERLKPKDQILLFKLLCLTVAAASIFIILAFPKYGVAQSLSHGGAWQGIFVGKNVSAVFFVFALTPVISFRPGSFTTKRVVYFLVIATFIVMSRSRGAWLVALIYIAIMMAVEGGSRLSRKSALMVAIPIAACFAGLAILALDNAPELLGLLGRDSTLTGRTEIWQQLLNSSLKRPFLGYGYQAFWAGLTGESATVIIATNWVFGYAHNGFLEILIQLGLVGLGLVALTFSQAVKNAVKCLRNDRPGHVDWYIGIVLLTMIYNFGESTIALPQQLLSMLYVVAYCGLSKSAAQVRYVREAAVLEAPRYRIAFDERRLSRTS